MSPLDRTLQPARGAIRHFDFPEVERRPLSQGLDLRVARLSRLPMVSVNLFFRAGEAGLSDEWAGLAVLTGDALEGGTKRRSGSALAEALESIGARTGVTTGWEGTSVALSCLADRLEEAMPLLIETMREPDFPEDEVD
ncbi:MAG: insulinase family protein, partial [Gemmatimonadales bacterium]|nr:insulinase family protein [Gemmatimonadales bacterium]